MCELLRYLDMKKNGIEVKELTFKCRYHKKKLEWFKHGNIFRGFRCLELLHAIYPRILALMYDAQIPNDEFILNCPSAENTVTIHIYTQPIKGVIRCCMNIVKRLLSPLYPMDVIKIVVFCKVISIDGQCLAGYKEGNTFEIYQENTMCPQALYSVFPSLLISSDNESCQCPSSVNKIVYGKI